MKNFYQNSVITFNFSGMKWYNKRRKIPMKIEYDIEIPKSDREDVNALYKFAVGNSQTMKLTFEEAREAKNSLAVLNRVIDKENWEMAISRLDNVVYIKKGI